MVPFSRVAALIALIGLGGMISSVSFATSNAEPPIPDGAQADQIRWSILPSHTDDFNQPSLDAKKWDNAPKSLIVGAWTFSKNNTFVADGKLNIAATQETHTRPFPDVCQGGKTVDRELYYKSGAVRTHTESVYGYYEAKMKGVKIFPGLSPAFWLYSDGHPFPDRDVVGSVDYSEIDIVELQQSDWHGPGDEDPINVMDHNLHARIVGKNGKTFWRRPKPYPEAQLTRYEAPFDPSLDFHTYAVENRKDFIFWYVDGKLIGKKPNLYWHRPMHMIFSMGLRRMFIKYNAKCQRADPNPNYIVQKGYPEDATMQVDYVKTWKVAPSVWLANASAYKQTTYQIGKSIKVTVNYHGGSDDYVDSALSLALVERNNQGFRKEISRVEDRGVMDKAKQYGGEIQFKLDIDKRVKPTNALPAGHYYTLEPRFTSSNGQLVEMQQAVQGIKIDI
ncbi:family 16 glycosylhydrolase [Algibacillus agarilyticus]|uniref:family 16 glycosylhydrolase n=1 Tax=Algibacillus agarilyticus TaxID=2234133 RepID=UPI000DCFB29C|nr:family 16 glycosylhydrolase [Algibacillus agarilyticus]